MVRNKLARIELALNECDENLENAKTDSERKEYLATFYRKVKEIIEG